MLQVPQHLVYLVHVPLRVVVLYAQLVAVGLAYGAVLVGPGVPDSGAQVVDIVALGLPYPQKLVYCRLPIGAADGEYGELLRQIVTVHDAELFHRVGALAVFPAGAHFPVRIPDAVVQNVPAILDKYLISSAHAVFSRLPRFSAGTARRYAQRIF